MTWNISGSWAFNIMRILRGQVREHEHPNRTTLKMLFVEELDLLVAACEDGNICKWYKIYCSKNQNDSKPWSECAEMNDRCRSESTRPPPSLPGPVPAS